MKKLRFTTVKDVFEMAMREEITFSKAVELLNAAAGFDIGLFINETGADIIANERFQQFMKGYNRERDIELYKHDELAIIAGFLSVPDWLGCKNIELPELCNWNEGHFNKMMAKPYTERLKIAGAFIAAQIDVINYTETLKQQAKIEKKLKNK